MNEEQSTKIKILSTAKDLFVTKGYRATTIREIAEETGVNSALIQYHFQGKQGLLIAIASELMEGEMEIVFETLDEEIESFEEMKFKLIFFLDMMIVRSLNKWQALKIVINEHYELMQIESFNFGNASISHLQKLEEFFIRAKKRSLIAKDIDLFILADNLMSLVLEQVLNWKANMMVRQFDISDKQSRKKWLQQTLAIFLHGIERR